MRLLTLTAFFFSMLAVVAGCKKRAPGIDRSDGELPGLSAPRVTRPITIDGRLDEPVWKSAGGTGPFVHPGNGREMKDSPVRAHAFLAWDQRALYAAIVVRDKKPHSPFARGAVDPHIWSRASGIELMIQPGDPGNNRDYYEIQVDVNGAVWDTRFDDYNRPRFVRGAKRFYGHQRFDGRLERAVRIQSGRYTVELALPWAALRSAPPRSRQVAIPPRPGDRWRMNLYSFKSGQRHALAWSPILGKGNFHRTSRFGIVTFKPASR